MWTHVEKTKAVDSTGSLGLSPDEVYLAISVFGTADDNAAEIVILIAVDGSVVTALDPGPYPRPEVVREGFSPDGRWLIVFTGTEHCGLDPAADWISLYDTDTWEEMHRLKIAGGGLERVTFLDSMDKVLLSAFNGPTELRSFPQLELLQTFAIPLMQT